ncbi:MAG: PDZ domain-containing protein [Acidobacteria bacterium]|nr:MAG: PDZ domain-containing protein [Acidobacteriota bacterium]
MAQHVVKIDYDNRTISLFDPASFEYKGQGTALPLVLRRGREPIVRVRVGLPGKAPIEAEVLLDAPHPRTITFGSPFAREHNLRDSMLKVSGRLLPSAAFGVGGKTELESGRLEWIEIGPYALNFPDAAFASDAKGGAFARSDIDGIIGGELLRRFSVILDYSRARMILEPSLSFLDLPFETDASGLLVRTTDQSHHEFEVAGVFDGTPASEAGIQKADRILSIDGKPASTLTLWELRTLFRKAPRRYTLILRRGTETKQITLQTRHLI